MTTGHQLEMRSLWDGHTLRLVNLDVPDGVAAISTPSRRTLTRSITWLSLNRRGVTKLT